MFRYCNFATKVLRESTIFAVSSGQGKCGVAVVRVSGPHSAFALKQLTGLTELPKPRYAILRSLKDPKSGEILDKGLVLWFPGPNSFTGEDSCELQIHGGTAVVAAVLKALRSIDTLRLATPGEFTRRAFYNGKLDLTEAEGLADLLSAETEYQRKQAFLQTEGYLKKLYDDWKQMLIHSLANLEAHIDFHEAENLDNDIIYKTIVKVTALHGNIKQHLSDGNRGERLRNGVKAVLIGETNVGKSSLINILCNRPVSIVTPLHGTTRDVLEVALDIGGYPVILSDTAGLRIHTTDVIEKEGMERAVKACQEADLILLIIDCKNYLTWYTENVGKNLFDFITLHTKLLNICDTLITKDKESNIIFKKQCILIANKIDLVEKDDLHIFQSFDDNISCKSLKGIDLLTNNIASKLKILCGEPSKEHPSMNQIRHREYLTLCVKYLQSFLDEESFIDTDVVLMTEKLRKALKQLDKLTGTSTTEQLLDVIFKEFCIGK